MFPETDSDLLRILESMLQFNPFFRPTAKELLQHHIFDKIRFSVNEADATHGIKIDMDENKYKRDYDSPREKTKKVSFS